MLKLILTISFLVIGATLSNGQITYPGPSEADSQVCYDHVGCFSNSFPNDNTALYLPMSPSDIGAEFVLFTPTNKINGQYLSYTDSSTIKKSSFNRKLPLKIIIHGFASNLNEAWIETMKNELLAVEDLNILVVGWGNGAKFPYYANSATNIRTVAKELNLLLTSIESVFSITEMKIHCIGHSLGAQMCGLSAQDSEIRFDRISGMDPAGPYFENVDKRARIDRSDADFVDVMHTNGGELIQSRFGIRMPCGHLDFYVNGGVFQPGCPNLLQVVLGCLGNLEACKGDPSKDIGCSHSRAYWLYIESIRSPCQFRSHVCEDSDKYENGDCSACEEEGCPSMGYHANDFHSLGPHYLSTSDSAPFCSKQYSFEMTVSKNSPSTNGEVTLKLNDGSVMSVIPAGTDIKPDTKVSHIFVSKEDYSSNIDAEMTFKRKFQFSNPHSTTFNADKVKIVNLDSGEVMSVCQKNYEWTDKQTVNTQLNGGDCLI